jgi:uncharacterized protein YggU (UPF0235/DUF167 family)
MKLTVNVKANQRRDQIFWDGSGLLVRIRAVPQAGQANNYLVGFLAGSLRVPQSLITIKRGQTSQYKLIEIDAPEADLRAQLEKLSRAPQQNELFE